MLPERLACHDIVDGVIVPRWFTDDDHAWLASLMDLHRRHVGRPRRELGARLREPAPERGPRDLRTLAAHVLGGLVRDRARAGRAARLARRELFCERARSARPRDVVVADVASRLAMAPAALEGSLFADFPGDRHVGRIPAGLSPASLALEANMALAQAFVGRATDLSIALRGRARRVVQQATWQGLLCTVRGVDLAGPCVLEVSGPLAVLRRSRLYARALASLVPVLPWCSSFRLEARCTLGRSMERAASFVLDDRDPLPKRNPPRRHDSRLEERFEEDVRKLAPDWDVLREPRAIPAAGTLVFPDFEIGPRGSPRERILVEIVGWWTREYLDAKLSRLRAARCDRLITCVAEGVCSSDPEALAGLQVLTFRGRRVDARSVLERARLLLARPAPPA